MQCPHCQHEAPADAKFCPECGARFALSCPACGSGVSPGQKFCAGCGERLSVPAPAADQSKPTETASAVAAERRQLTVMFCDLVGSTALAHSVDPEQLRELMRNYQEACAAVVEKYGGHVAQYLGDGLMVYFGWPQAHEDDAERAVRAGLEIVSAVKQVASAQPLQLRIGVATGPVVVGETGAGDASVPKAAVGETPNVAARLQGLAAADELIIGPVTRRLIGLGFECEDLGAHALKGIVEPVPAFRVRGEARTEGRFEAAHEGTQLTPLVGREEEMQLLLRRWQQAKDGEGQIVLLAGEPGVGKSRILRVLRERMAADPHTRLRYQCSPFHTGSAFHPAIEQFERAAGFAGNDDTEARLDKMERLLAQSGVDLKQIAPLFASLLSLPTQRYVLPRLSPQQLKERLIAAQVEQVLALARAQPVLVLFEDAHWADPTTLEVLDRLVGSIERTRVLMVLTYRAGLALPWVGQPRVTTLTLARLSRREAAELSQRVAGGRALPEEVLDQIVAKTDGVPLFVEEITKAVLESGVLRLAGPRYELDGPLPPLAIPSTLHDSLMARLDRLAPVKEVAQIAAVIGREFDFDLLAAVAPLDRKHLAEALDRLVAAELVFRQGQAPAASYVFKHALVQDAAYESILKSRRQQLHTRIARTLETQFAALAETSPELPAMHFERAALADEAVAWTMRAGSRAQARSANKEAVSHFERALSLLDQTSAQQERPGLELELRTNLGVLFTTLEGWTSPRAYTHCQRAHELGDMAGREDPWMIASSALTGQVPYMGSVADARKLGEELVRTALVRGNRVHEMLAYDAYGFALMYSGRSQEAIVQWQAAFERYDREADVGSAFRHGYDRGANALGMLAYMYWETGCPDRALQLADAAVELARSVGHSFTLAFALTYPGADLSHFMRDPQRTLLFAREGQEVAEKAGYAYLAHCCSFHHGWCVVGLGQVKEGVSRMLAALEDMKQLGALTRRTPRLTAQLADALRSCGRADEGLQILEASPDRAPGNSRVRYAEIYRIEGDLHLDKGRPDPLAAEACYQEAIAIAIEDSQRMRQLRASTSLARLWLTQGKADEAHTLLRPLYDSFTEGFATPDLMDARSVLDEAGARSRSAA